MSEVQNNSHKSVREVTFKHAEVRDMLVAAAVDKIKGSPTWTGNVRAVSVVRNDCGGYIVDVIIDETPRKEKKS